MSITAGRASTVAAVADWKLAVRRVLYPAYEARLARHLPSERIPKHVGVMLDGNRRWAKAVGADTAHGHRAGADNIEPLLGWCEEIGVEVVTLWLLSTDNLNRPAAELEPAAAASSSDAVDAWPPSGRWRLHPVGALDLLPARDGRAAQGGGRGRPRDVDGHAGQRRGRLRRAARDRRRRAVAAARARRPAARSIEELAEVIDVEHIAEHLYTKGQPDPDLVIRTSGEQRLGGFLLWQSAHCEFYFCEAYWPDFRHVDFLRAAARLRRARAPLRRLSRAGPATPGSAGCPDERGRCTPARPGDARLTERVDTASDRHAPFTPRSGVSAPGRPCAEPYLVRVIGQHVEQAGSRRRSRSRTTDHRGSALGPRRPSRSRHTC